jgi:nitroreductase
MHDFQNLLRKRRSIREFTDREVPEGLIGTSSGRPASRPAP